MLVMMMMRVVVMLMTKMMKDDESKDNCDQKQEEVGGRKGKGDFQLLSGIFPLLKLCNFIRHQVYWLFFFYQFFSSSEIV